MVSFGLLEEKFVSRYSSYVYSAGGNLFLQEIRVYVGTVRDPKTLAYYY
jgi:hypothetical protein